MTPTGQMVVEVFTIMENSSKFTNIEKKLEIFQVFVVGLCVSFLISNAIPIQSQKHFKGNNICCHVTVDLLLSTYRYLGQGIYCSSYNMTYLLLLKPEW